MFLLMSFSTLNLRVRRVAFMHFASSNRGKKNKFDLGKQGAVHQEGGGTINQAIKWAGWRG